MSNGEDGLGDYIHFLVLVINGFAYQLHLEGPKL
jgi:hypothetical protein